VFHVKDIIPDVLTESEDRMNGKIITKTSINTGYSILDNMTGGLEPGLIIVGARPSMGKSDLMLNWALNIAKTTPVAIMSAEMKKIALVRRMLAAFHNVDSLHIRKGTIERAILVQMWQDVELGGRRIYIDDSSAPTALQIRSKLTTLKAKHDIGIAFIDHLHRLSWHTKHSNDNANWRSIVDSISDTGRDLNIPIVLLQQLNRTGKGDPVLQELREAGEEPADVVIMLNRENYQQFATHDRLKYIIRKDRTGIVGTVWVEYNLTTGKQGESADQSETPGPEQSPVIYAGEKEHLPF
jgi:replicative DNA helicase